MNLRQVAVLLLVAVVLSTAAVWLSKRSAPAAASPGQGRLLPELQARLADVDSITVTGAGDRRVLSLLRRDGVWLVQERDNWIAEDREVQRLLRGLAAAERVEAKTTLERHHAVLGVEDVAAAGAPGVRVQIGGDSGYDEAVVIGNPNPHGRGHFVRIDSEAQAWLVDVEFDLVWEPGRWLQRELLDVASRNVARLRIEHGDGEPIVLERDLDSAAGHVLAGAPDGVAMDRLQSAAELFEGLRLDDVARDRPGDSDLVDAAAAPAGAGAEEAPIAVMLQTDDGLELAMQSWRAGTARWVRFEVGFDPARALDWAEHTLTLDRHALEASQRPGPGAAEAAADHPDADSDPDAGVAAGGVFEPLDPVQRVDAARARAEALRERLEGWAFKLPSPKQAVLEAPREAYLPRVD